MAYLVRCAGDRIEIRESRSTPSGPRARQLARFRGALTPTVLARAAARATRPFDAAALAERAHALGIPVETHGPEPEARALLARLRRGDALDPVVAELLVRTLEGAKRAPVPESLAEVAEWIGATPKARGAALWDLLDTFGRIAASRPTRRERPRPVYPSFSSQTRKAAS